MKTKPDLDIAELGPALLAFLRDHGLEILAVIVPIILFFLYQKKKKSITYTPLSNEPLFRIPKIKGKLEVLYEGNVVEELHLLIIKLQNSGNVTISSEDFKTPITVELNNEAQILSNEVIETKPEKLDYNISISRNTLKIDPMLFNEGESMTFKMLISKFSQIKSVHGRIVGISEIKEVDKEAQQVRAARIIGVLPIVMAIILYYLLPSEAMYVVIEVYVVVGLLIILFPKQFRQMTKLIEPRWAQ